MLVITLGNSVIMKFGELYVFLAFGSFIGINGQKYIVDSNIDVAQLMGLLVNDDYFFQNIGNLLTVSINL